MSEESHVTADLRGRDHATGPLRRAVGGGAHLIRISGRAGVGVSALVEGVLAGFEDKRIITAAERRRHQPPFGVFDSVARQLAAALEETPRASIGPAAHAATIFDCLAPYGDGSEGAGRAAAFDGFVSLIEELGIDVLFLDDLQWLDRDGQLLLDHLLAAEPTGLTVIVAGDQTPKLVQPRNLSIALRPLGVEALIEIAMETAGPDAELDTELLAELDYDGLPLLAELYARALLRDLEPSLEAIAKYSVELAPELLARAVAVDGPVAIEDDERGAVEALVSLGVLTRREDAVQIDHRVLFSTIASALSPADVIAAHDRIADRLLESDGASPDAIVRHLLGADRVGEAAPFALEAGAQVEARHACSLAADLYAIAAQHGSEVELPRVSLARARALERAGRYAEAAEAWDEIGALEPERAADYAINAAQALLAGADLAGGARRLDDTLATMGEAPIGSKGLSGLFAGLGFTSGRLPGRLRVGARPDPERRARADRDLRMALMVGFFDPPAGVRVLRRARKTYAELGVIAEVAWCDFLFAAFAENRDSSPGRPRLVDRYRTAAERLCRDHNLATPRIEAVRSFLDGVEAKRQRRWVDANESFERALSVLDEAGVDDVIEYAFALTQIGLTAAMQQDIVATERAVARYRAYLRERGDISLATYVNLLSALAQTWRGQIRTARATVSAARQLLPDSTPTIQTGITEVIACLPELYGDNEAAALRSLEGGGFGLIERFGLFEVSQADFYASIAALAEAIAVRAGTVGASIRRARKHARIAEKSARVAGGDAERALAYLADAEGHPDESVLLLQRAQETAREAGRPIAMAIASYQRGLRLGGSAGDSLVSAAVEKMQSLGASPALLSEDPTYR